jgi:Domain of unknown function (DUF1851)
MSSDSGCQAADGSPFTIQPDAAAVLALRANWRWLLGEGWTPLMFSAIGDVFLEVAAGTLWWLNTATGALEQVAESRPQFTDLLEGDRADEWLFPGLVEALHSHGKVLAADQCYTYAILPVFETGSYSVENMHPVSAAEHYSMTGHLHEHIRKLPDGARVRLIIGD